MPEVLIESVDTTIPKVLHSMRINFADLANSNWDISEYPTKAYNFEGTQKLIYLRLKFLKKDVVDPETNYTNPGTGKKPMTEEERRKEQLAKDIRDADVKS